MISKNKTAVLFFILSLVFALVSIQSSSALSQGKIERNASASVADDENGVLILNGFNNRVYDMKNGYTRFGSITNNTNQTIKLTVTITPDITGINNIYTKFGVKIKNKTIELRYKDSSKQAELTLSPGQVVDVKAYLTGNILTTVPVEFAFTAADTTGIFKIQLESTDRTPRRIVCY